MLIRMLIATCLLFLAGCAQQPTKLPLPKASKSVATALPATQRWQQHQQQLVSLDHWQAEGRIAASNANKGGNASFVWTQRGDAYQIKLFGPFGSGSVYINGRPNFVELREANGKVTRAQSSELLMKKVAGMQVPVEGLRYWLRGIPAPSTSKNAEQLTNSGYLKHLVQQGWQIDYENYHEQTQPILPNKLRLQNGPIKLKLIITRWKTLGSNNKEAAGANPPLSS